MNQKTKPTAFEQGQISGQGPAVPNPFAEGSVEHNNFEVGKRFAEKNSKSHYRFHQTAE